MRYLITFSCYGVPLHGNSKGSVDRCGNVPGTPVVEHAPGREFAERRQTRQLPYEMDEIVRAAVLEAVQNHCQYRNWLLLACHVRTNHVHLVIEAEVRPEKILNEVKAYASRRLNQLGREPAGRIRWSRHGSTKWLWSDEEVRNSIRYVAEQQGEPMAGFVSDVV